MAAGTIQPGRLRAGAWAGAGAATTCASHGGAWGGGGAYATGGATGAAIAYGFRTSASAGWPRASVPSTSGLRDMVFVLLLTWTAIGPPKAAPEPSPSA